MGFAEPPLELFSLEKRPPGCRAVFVFALAAPLYSFFRRFRAKKNLIALIFADERR